MDLDENELQFENDKARPFAYELSECHYAIFLCPPIYNFPEESFAFLVMIPARSEDCGLLRVYNPTKESRGEGFCTSKKELRQRFFIIKRLVERNQNASLIWEGNINGLGRNSNNINQL